MISFKYGEGTRISLSEATCTLFTIFLISLIGYVIGRIRIKGIGLGTAGIFFVGLMFGHFGVILPASFQTFGLILFITTVGLSAGPGFLQRLKNDGVKYGILCLATSIIGGLICIVFIFIFQIDAPLVVGIMTGAFTTSPGFAAAKDAVSSTDALRVAAGYGVAYPIGVICKVLFIQLIPKILRVAMEKERALIALKPETHTQSNRIERRLGIDGLGIFVICFTAVIGIMIGSIAIPLPGNGKFSLGNAGGPLIVGLLFGYVGHIGFVNLSIDKSIVSPLKEIGLLLFFSGAGVEGGHGIAEIFKNYGLLPLIYALIFVILPLLSGFLIFRYVLRIPLLNGLGSMTASMTCTPSLAVLIQTAGTDDVAAAYATTYPIALISLVLLVQILVKF